MVSRNVGGAFSCCVPDLVRDGDHYLVVVDIKPAGTYAVGGRVVVEVRFMDRERGVIAEWWREEDIVAIVVFMLESQSQSKT